MALIENDAEELLSDLTDGWYRGFLCRIRTGLGTGNQSSIETTRAAWLTPANLERYYDVAAEMLVDAGIAHRVEGFDRAQAYAVMLIIDHLERMLSYDETDLTLDQTGGSKSNSLRTITSGKGDYGETAATKSGKKVTGTGGRIENKALALYVVFGGGETFDARWCQDKPVGDVLRKVMIDDGKGGQVEVIALYSANKNFSMTTEKCLDYLEQVLLPSLRTVFADLRSEEDAGKGFQGVEFCDGCQVHLSYKRLLAAKNAGLHVCLRVPHTTSETQGEDTVLFGIFKTLFERAKAEAHRELELCLPAGKTAPLTMELFGRCLKGAWECAFSARHIESAWVHDGLNPFNRKCYWDAVMKERKLEAARTKAERAGQLKAIAAPETGIMRGMGRGWVGGAQAGAGGYHMAVYKPPAGDSDEDGADEDQDDEGGGDDASANAKLRAARAGKKVSKPLGDAIEALQISEELPDVEDMSEAEVRSALRGARVQQHDIRVAYSAETAARLLKNSTRIQTSSDVFGKAGSATGELHMAEARASFKRASDERDEEEVRRVAKRQKVHHDIIETDSVGKSIIASLEQGEESIDTLLKKQCVQLVKHITGDNDTSKIVDLKERLRGLQAVKDAIEKGLAALQAQSSAVAAESERMWRAAQAAGAGGSGGQQPQADASAPARGGREGGRGRGGRGGARGGGVPAGEAGAVAGAGQGTGAGAMTVWSPSAEAVAAAAAAAAAEAAGGSGVLAVRDTLEPAARGGGGGRARGVGLAIEGDSNMIDADWAQVEARNRAARPAHVPPSSQSE